jgi:hypothetical protein
VETATVRVHDVDAVRRLYRELPSVRRPYGGTRHSARSAGVPPDLRRDIRPRWRDEAYPARCLVGDRSPIGRPGGCGAVARDESSVRPIERDRVDPAPRSRTDERGRIGDPCSRRRPRGPEGEGAGAKRRVSRPAQPEDVGMRPPGFADEIASLSIAAVGKARAVGSTTRARSQASNQPGRASSEDTATSRSPTSSWARPVAPACLAPSRDSPRACRRRYLRPRSRRV